MHPHALAGFSPVIPEGSSWKWGAAAWVLGVLPLCFSGLGLLVRRMPAMGRVAWEFLPAVGLAAYICAGGLLNLLHLATPPSVWALLAAGLVSFVIEARRFSRPPGPLGAGPLLLGLLVLGLMAFTAATQLAPRAYNWSDDLQKYFTHPVRMLETGTVFGSPLSSIGKESLGGIAFVQASLLVCLPLGAMNGADAVLGLLLCLLPFLAFGIRNPRLAPVAAIAISAVVIIDPYYVNVSALYLGSALIIAAVALSGYSEEGKAAFTGGSPVALGLLYSGLIALKPTLLLFAVPHLLAVVIAVAFLQGSPMKGLHWGLLALASTLLCTAPWIGVHLPHYLSAAAQGTPQSTPLHESVDVLRTVPVVDSSTGLEGYTILVEVMLLLAIVGVRAQRCDRASAANAAALVGASVGVMAYPAMLYVFPRVVGYSDADPIAVRYFVPLAIAVFPASYCAAAASFAGPSPLFSSGRRLALSLLVGAVALASFGSSALFRLEEAYDYHTMLLYPGAHSSVLARALENALGRPKQAEVRGLQDRIPAGASVIAWIYDPCFLDYARNTIYDADIAGIANRWASIPPADYYIWEYRGSPDLSSRVRRIAESLQSVDRLRAAQLVAFEGKVSAQLTKGTVVFRDAQYVVVRTNPN